MRKKKNEKLLYEEHKKRVLRRASEISRAGREIGIPIYAEDVSEGEEPEIIGYEIPKVADPKRREVGSANLLDFCRTYFPGIFTKEVSLTHPKITAIMQEAAIHGGKYAWCDFRGGGKTTLSECFILWTMLYGHDDFVLYCGATKEAAADSFLSVKSELEHNDLLLEDFPEVCFPIRCMEGKPQRAHGMLFCGVSVGLVWTGDEVVLPTIPGSAASGCIFRAMGYTGRLRGQKYKTPDGRNVRPSCVIVDDIQKDTTSRNPRNVANQLSILKNTIGGLRTRGHKFTVLVPGTRLGPNCFMSRLTERKENPEYGGRRFRAMDRFPARMDLWEEYRKLWLDTTAAAQEVNPDDEFAWKKGKDAATEFYRENRDEMDDCCEVSWPAMYEPDEISGIQNVMNIYLMNEEMFWTEYQNEPKTGGGGAVPEITDALLQSKIAEGIPKGRVPAGTQRLTMGADVQGELIYWLVVAWKTGYDGHIVDYGTIPEQPTRDFTAEKPQLPLSVFCPNMGLEARLNLALNALVKSVVNHAWETESGETMQIDRGLIDSNWEPSRETIATVINRHFRHFLRNGKFEAYPVLPARGRGTRAGGAFYNNSRREVESRTQFSYLEKPQKAVDLTATVWVNTNKTKSFTAERLITPPGAPQSLTLCEMPYGGHALLFNHLTSEFAQAASLGEMRYDRWQMKPGRTENHWWDCLVHCVVCNAMEGDRLSVHDAPSRGKRSLTGNGAAGGIAPPNSRTAPGSRTVSSRTISRTGAGRVIQR